MYYEIKNSEDPSNIFSLQFQPRNSIIIDNNYGILTFKHKIINNTNTDDINKSILQKENIFSINPIKYDKNAKEVITKLFMFIEQSYHDSVNTHDDIENSLSIVYKSKYKFILVYKDGELFFKIQYNDIDNNESIIDFTIEFDYQMEMLYKFFNVVMHFINHKDEKVALKFYEMEGSWSNIKLDRVDV